MTNAGISTYNHGAYRFFSNKSDDDLRTTILIYTGRIALGDIRGGTPMLVAALRKAVADRADRDPSYWNPDVRNVELIVEMLNVRK